MMFGFKASRRPSLLVASALTTLALVQAAWSQADSDAIFVANNGDAEGSVTSFTVQPDGSLRFADRVITGTTGSGTNAFSIDISPDGTHLAVGHTTAATVLERMSILRIEPDATLTSIASFDVLPGDPVDIDWVRDDLIVVIDASPMTTNRILSYSINTAVPSFSPRGSLNVTSFAAFIVGHHNGDHVYLAETGVLVNSSHQSRVNTYDIGPTGVLSVAQMLPTGTLRPLDIAIDSTASRLFVSGGTSTPSVGVYDIVGDGTLSEVSGSPFATGGAAPAFLAVSPQDDKLFVGHGSSTECATLQIAGDGSLTRSGTSATFGSRGTLGRLASLGSRLYVTDDKGLTGVRAFDVAPDGSLTTIGGLTSTQGVEPTGIVAWDAPDAACPCELDGDDTEVGVFDLLAYLALWFVEDLAANFDANPAVDVFDLLLYLECWFPASLDGICP